MNRSSNITNVAVALLKAQKLMGAATKEASNPYFKSKYADYGSVLEACKDVLNNNGILITQPHVFQEGLNFVETTLTHAESGEFISSLTQVVCSKQNDPQALGSAITYARRYGLQSLVAMPTEDDDANSAMNFNSKTKMETTASKPPVASKPVTEKTNVTKLPTSAPTKSTFKTPTVAEAPKAETKASNNSVKSELGW